MTLEEYQENFNEDEAVGWYYIDEELAVLYGEQEPQHYAPETSYTLGGESPLDGTSIYESKVQEPHFHIISYGMSELYYEEELVGKEFSKWGFEFTFRLKPFEADNGNPIWVVDMMNNLAAYVFETDNWFEQYHFIPFEGTIKVDTDTAIGGVVFVEDPELGKISTPHGEVTFLQIVGVTFEELERLDANPTFEEVELLVNELKKDNPLLITDLNRK